MVKFRGVNVHIVSQFEAARLPEYSTAQGVENGQHIVAHYIPIHTGAQIWFEYSIDGPHPPNAMYLFKLFINGKNITNWDCTAKHDYHGKAMYSLKTIEYGSFKQRAVLQNVFMFSSTEQNASPNTKDLDVEIRIHRVQQRRRIRELPIDPDLVQQLQHTRNSLRTVSGGFIERGRPVRRYQYLLLDPQDEPYATFRFYCRNQEYLKQHHILGAHRSLSPTSPATSAIHYSETETSPQKKGYSEQGQFEFTGFPNDTETDLPALLASFNNTLDKFMPMPSAGTEHTLPPLRTTCTNYSATSDSGLIVRYNPGTIPSGISWSPTATLENSPRSRTADPWNDAYIDDILLPCPISLSPTLESSPLLPEALRIGRRKRDESLARAPFISESKSVESIPKPALVMLPEPTASSGKKDSLPRLTHQRHRPSNLKLTLDGGTNVPDFEGGRNVSDPLQPTRPLSPFTSSGFLRRLTSNPFPGRSADTGTEDSPPPGPPRPVQLTVDRERGSEEATSTPKTSYQGRHSPAEEDKSKLRRGGQSLISFLERRAMKDKSAGK